MKFLKKGKFECYKDVHFKTQPGPDRTQTYVRQRLLHVAQSVEHWSRDPGSRVQFPAGGFGFAFFATGPGWVLKCVFLWHSNLPTSNLNILYLDP